MFIWFVIFIILLFVYWPLAILWLFVPVFHTRY